jgi:hypothetical protein
VCPFGPCFYNFLIDFGFVPTMLDLFCGVKELVEELIINIHILKQPLINYKKSIIHNKIDFH